MPDVREVYEMVTKQKPSDSGALERQGTRQIRTMRNRKVGAFAVSAAIGVAAVAVILGTREKSEPQTPVGGRPTASPMEVAEGFVEAYGALDAEKVVGYLADDADASSVIGWVGAQGGEGPLAEFQLIFSLLDAQLSHTLDSCKEQGRSASVTNLRCSYDLHWLRSKEIGRGPFSGSYLDLIVRDGEIAHVAIHLDTGESGPQMWEPFARWVSRNHPEDVLVMYEDETQSLERVTEESITLWDRYTRDYVEDVNQGGAGQ